jgi:teichuronic acid biosynthesis protein TuaE
MGRADARRNSSSRRITQLKIKFNAIIHLFLISTVVGVAISYSKLYLFHVSLVLLISIFIYFKTVNFKIKIPKLPTHLHLIFYFMLIWYFLSLSWSIKIEYSLVYLFYIMCGLSIVITLIYYARDLETQNKVFKILAAVFIIEIFLSLLELFTHFRLPVSPFSKYVTYFAREPKIDLDDTSDMIAYILQSPTGFEWNPNNLAAAMLIILPFFLLHKKKIIKLAGSFSTLLIIIYTTSRAVLIATVFMAFAYLFFLNKKRLILSVVVIALFSIFISLTIDLLSKWENPHVQDIMAIYPAVVAFVDPSYSYKESSDSIGIRQQLILNGLKALRNTYFWGVGGGCSIAIEDKYGGLGHYERMPMHNFWVEMLVDSGILFFVSFIGWYLYIIVKLYLIGIYTNHSQYKYYSQSLFLSMSSFVFGAISPSSTIYLLPMWLLFGFAIVNINNYERYKKINSNFIQSLPALTTQGGF